MIRIWFLGMILSVVAAVVVGLAATFVYDAAGAMTSTLGAFVGYVIGVSLIIFFYWLMER